MKEYGEEADEQEHLKQREIEGADKYLIKYDSFLATKTISETSTRRLMIKKNSGAMRGAVFKIIALPTVNSPKDKKDFTEKASKVLSRRSALSWDKFDQFVSDAKAVAIVEVVKLSDTEIYAACSCDVGVKGKSCVHAVAVYMKHGIIKRPSEIQMIGRFSKNKGKIPDAKKQMRF